MSQIRSYRSTTMLSQSSPPGVLDGDDGLPPTPPGTIVIVEGRECVVIRVTATRKIVFENTHTGDTINLARADCAELWNEGSFLIRREVDSDALGKKVVFFDRPLRTFGDGTRKRIANLRHYLIRMDRDLRSGELRCRSKDDVAEWIQRQPLPPYRDLHLKRGAVMKAYRLWIAGGHRAAALAHGNATGERQSPFDSMLIDIIYEVLETRPPGAASYLSDARVAIAEQIDIRVADGEMDPCDPPSVSTIAKYKRKLDKYWLELAENGAFQARRRFQPSGKTLVPDLPFEHVEIDHTQLPHEVCIALQDPNAGEVRYVVGKPWLTVVIDAATRYILAIILGLDPPSSIRTLRALKMACGPKDHIWRRLSEIKNPSHATGIPFAVTFDNGKDFHSKDVTQTLSELSIDVGYAGIYRPDQKPFVERFNRTIKLWMLKFPGGYTFKTRKSGPTPKELRGIKKMTLDEMEEMLWRWVLDVYHQRPHAGLHGATPAEAMRLGLARLRDLEKRGDPSHRLRTYFDYTPLQFDSFFTIRVENALADETRGIRFKNLFYNNSEMAEIARFSPSGSVDFMIDPDDLGSAIIYNPVRHQLTQIPCTWPVYANGLGYWQHMRVQGRLRQHAKAEAKRTGQPYNPSAVARLDDYLRNEAELLSQIFEIMGAPLKPKRRDLKSAAAMIGRNLDIALAVARLDAIDIANGRVPVGMEKFMKLERGSDGEWALQAVKRDKRTARPDPFASKDQGLYGQDNTPTTTETTAREEAEVDKDTTKPRSRARQRDKSDPTRRPTKLVATTASQSPRPFPAFSNPLNRFDPDEC